MKKSLLIIVAVAMIISAGCEKQSIEPTQEPVITSTWYIVPVGLPADSFNFLIHSSLDSARGLNVWYGGKVSDGPLKFEQISGEEYSVLYLDTIGGNWHSCKAHTATAENYSDSLPATIY